MIIYFLSDFCKTEAKILYFAAGGDRPHDVISRGRSEPPTDAAAADTRRAVPATPAGDYASPRDFPGSTALPHPADTAARASVTY